MNKRTIFICHGTRCVSSGSPKIKELIEKEVKRFKIRDVEVKLTGCHGFCQRGPIVIIEPEGIFYSELKEKDAKDIVRSHLKNNKPVERLFYKDPITGKRKPYYKDIEFYKKQSRIILRNCGHINPESINDYLSVGGYQALKKVLFEMSPEKVIDEIKRSGLRGRGGAGFPTGRKWELCRQQKDVNSELPVKYVICNADEGDPGAFMDRSILEADPHSVLEGLIIAGYSIGAREGYIYIRAEYPLAIKRFRMALEKSQSKNFLGKNILGSNFNFNVTINEGAGAFVCGEETALIASIEGKRGMPRPKPPFPAQSGLWGKPTNINNVKTLASVPIIISKGAGWFSGIGTDNSKGTAVFALTGKISNCGLVEVPMGTTLREIIFSIGGGIPANKSFKAVQTDGPSGGCLTSEYLDTPVDYETLAAAGSIMGSGGMVVMDEDTCMIDVARYSLDFTTKESCGKCVPCRVGSKHLLSILEDISAGKGTPEDTELLTELANSIKKASLCGLGKTAPNPVLTTIRYFKHEYEQHIKYKKCPAAVCKELVSSACQHICPIGTEAGVYISLIAGRRFREAFDIIRKDNPLPSVCARVCHHPCESKCHSGKWGDSIAIRTLKRFASDYAIRKKIYLVRGKNKISKDKVAIVGSGPAGLSAAWTLARKGYAVTVFEKLSVAGGALSVCIPEYRLPKKIIDLDVQNIKNLGVKIKTNIEVGKDILFSGLMKTHKAVFIATGTHKSRKLGIPGEDCDGIIDALEFLKESKQNRKIKLGKIVGVIGGGNAAIDAARVAARNKDCKKVILIYRRTRTEMPAFKDEVELALDEGIKLQLLTAPSKVVAINGKVTGLECIRMELGEPDSSGRRKPIPVKGSEFVIELDNIIVAIGEQPDVSFLGKIAGLKISHGNTIEADPETFATGIPGVFAGGDIVTGPNTVIEAISAGKIAGEMIDRYICGKELAREYKITRPSMYVPPVKLTQEETSQAKRIKVKHIKGIEGCVSETEAIKEAKRCLRCELETEDGKKSQLKH